MSEIKRILVANRGEIAVRIMRTVRAMGLESVGVFTDADGRAFHLDVATHKVEIGTGPAVSSYLSIERILAAARKSGADAIHPGYGFLSENADFAQACAAEGIVFIGPSPDAIRAMGSKSEAKALMEKAGVPLVPGYHASEQSDAALAQAAQAIGFPIMVKASAGGGGRGMRIVHGPDELADALASARREARGAFGNDHLLLERYLDRARHIEVQVFGDRHGNLVHLFERDCSVQRRHQKIIEEAPAPGLDGDLRKRLLETAVTAARAVGYTNAGTVEFMVAGDAFFFIEMNTRLQVEHPVTEAITGIDLVEWQIRVARGETLPLEQKEIRCAGHAIEARLNAEDPRRDARPTSGRLGHYNLPYGAGTCRIDTGYAENRVVPPFYDSLLAKLIGHGESRDEALDALIRALRSSQIEGLATNRQLLLAILEHPVFAAAAHDTTFIATHAPSVPPTSDRTRAVAAVARLLDLKCLPGVPPGHRTWRLWGRGDGPGISASPWALGDGWRSGQPPSASVCLADGLETCRVEVELLKLDDRIGITAHDDHPPVELDAVGFRIRVDGRQRELRIAFSDDRPNFDAEDDDGSFLGLAFAGDRLTVVTRNEDAVFEIVDLRAAPVGATAGGGQLVAPMPGTVAAVSVSAGQQVTAGQTLVVVEAMKMEHAVKAPHDGTVSRLDCAVGDLVREGQELVVLEAFS